MRDPGPSGAGPGELETVVPDATPKGVWKRRYIRGVGTEYENAETGEIRAERPDDGRILTEAEWEAEQAAKAAEAARPPEQRPGPPRPPDFDETVL